MKTAFDKPYDQQKTTNFADFLSQKQLRIKRKTLVFQLLTVVHSHKNNILFKTKSKCTLIVQSNCCTENSSLRSNAYCTKRLYWPTISITPGKKENYDVLEQIRPYAIVFPADGIYHRF